MKRLLLLVLLLVPLAAAHSEPHQSDPAGGSRLEDAPIRVSVDFTEPVFDEGSWIRVVDATGARVDNDDLQITGDARPRMEVTLPPLPDGAYSIRWQTYSQSDGHTIQGTIGFAVGGFAPPATSTDAETDLDAAPAAARAFLYAGIALGLGAIAHAWVARSSPAPRGLMLGAGVAGTATIVLAVDTWQETGLAFEAYFAQPGGTDFILRIGFAAIALAAAAWMRKAPTARHVVLAAWFAFTWLTSGYGHVTRQGLWAHALEWSHLVAAGVWVGGLYFLFQARHHPAFQDMGRRFTRLAQWAVAIIVLSGSIITVLLVGALARDTPEVLFQDSWTWFLVTKVSLVGFMLVLAGLNRYVFLAATPPAWLAKWMPDWEREGALRRSIQWEAILSIGTLVAAGLLLSVSPPSGESLAYSDGLERTAQGDDYLSLLQVTPQPVLGGSHTMRFYITEEATGEPLTNNTCGRDDCVRASWSVAGINGTEQDVDLIAEGDGWWRADDVLFVQPGETIVRLDVQSAYVYLDQLTFGGFVV